MLCGATGGGAATVVAVVGVVGSEECDHAVTGGAVSTVPPVVGVCHTQVDLVEDVVEVEVGVDPGFAVVVVAREVGEVDPRGEGVVPPVSSSSTWVFDKCATSLGATPLATRATAAKARLTAITTPATHTPTSSTPRLTPRFSSDYRPGVLKPTASAAQVSPAGRTRRSGPPYPGSAWQRCSSSKTTTALRAPLVHSLTSRGHTVTEASSGLPALQSVVDDPPDVVLLDLGLPDIDGGDLLKMLPRGQRGPVDHRHGTRRRTGDRPAARRRRRRLHRQAVLGRAGRCADPRRVAPDARTTPRSAWRSATSSSTRRRVPANSAASRSR